MPVEITNTRKLRANAGSNRITVAELRRFIAGLSDGQAVDVGVTKGYSDMRESTPDSVTLTINLPEPAATHLPQYPPGARGGTWQGDVPVEPR